MRRKTVFGMISGILLIVILAAFVLAQRSYRMLFIVCAFVLLAADCTVLIRKKPNRVIGILFSLILSFVLFLCTAPGIMKPVFQTLEELRFSLLRPVYERDIDTLRSGTALNGANDPGELDHAENHLRFFANDVLIRQQEEHFMVVYITEPDSCSGYAWVSDRECQSEWMANFTEKTPAGDNWYYVRMY